MVKIEESEEKKRSAKIEKSVLKKRRGLCFSSDELDKYETLLFGLNGGGIEGILAATEDLKIEEEIQNNKWHEERRVLTTLDCKRKQRFAVSQRKKEN